MRSLKDFYIEYGKILQKIHYYNSRPDDGRQNLYLKKLRPILREIGNHDKEREEIGKQKDNELLDKYVFQVMFKPLTKEEIDYEQQRRN